MKQIKTTGWVLGIIIGASIGVFLPTGLNIIVGLCIAIAVAKTFIRMSIIEVEEDEEHFI